MRKILIISLLLILVACNSAKEIPYFEQISEGNCMQTQLKMVLKYYYPEKDYSFEYLDEITGRTKGKWTWTSQALKFIIDEGLDAYYYSTSPYDEILEKGEPFILEFYGEEDGKVIIEHTNFDALYSSIETMEATGRYINKKLDFTEVEKEFNNGAIIIALVDLGTLYNEDKPYLGHFVTITEITKNQVIFHDSGGSPNTKVEKQQFIKAWNAPGTDNDIIIIYESNN